MYVFTMPAENWDETAPSKQVIRHLIEKHQSHVSELQKLKAYYEGKHEILNDTERDNKLVCNHAKDITDTATAYFLGNPIVYNADQEEEREIFELTNALDLAGADEADGDNAQDLSIYGRAYEYIFTGPDETNLEIKNLAPENTFMVYDDTIEQKELFGVYYYARKDDTDRQPTTYIATVLTEHYKYVLNILDTDRPQQVSEEPEEHYKGEVPLIEILNNKLAIGDYELQIPLIDAYNALMSDRITDKEQFIDAILAVYGTLLSDEDAETAGDGKGGEKVMKRLGKEKYVEMPDGSKMEYLIRTFDEAGVEVLKKALEQDIHKFSHIPCLTDEAFGGNVSGVAMEFKLLGLENITKIKTRYYKKALRKRLRIFCNFLNTRSGINIDPAKVTPTFSRALPKNMLEISQYVANLKGVVSRKTLLAQIPFVTDPAEEIKAVEEENREALELQQALFREPGSENTPPEWDEEEEDQEEEDEVNAEEA